MNQGTPLANSKTHQFRKIKLKEDLSQTVTVDNTERAGFNDYKADL
jgi:hypothetical protein